jgi:polysaccharide pyruvyl transferase WcaK-like protein
LSNKKTPTFGLYGIFGTYNYGCEAIVRGTQKIIHNVFPDAKIVYASFRPEDDRRRLTGCNIEIIPVERQPLFHPAYANIILAYFTGTYIRGLYTKKTEWVKECDAILAIGGDEYYPSTDIFGTKYNYLVNFGEKVKIMSKKLVPWGVSMGPYSNNQVKNYYIKHVSKTDLVVSREPQTTKYLNSCGLLNVIERPDPAFSLAQLSFEDNGINSKSNKCCIGINLSPLSARVVYKNDQYDQIIAKQASSISRLVSRFDCEILLIPHVFAKHVECDDDLSYLKKIKDNILDHAKDRVSIMNEDVGFLGIRKTLYKCDLVIASRMHCAINAISIGIPTILLRYSNKSLGMAEYIYENRNYSIPLYEFCSPKIEEMIETVLENKVFLRQTLKKRVVEILNQDYSFLELLF